jgi:hypothetical protein
MNTHRSLARAAGLPALIVAAAWLALPAAQAQNALDALNALGDAAKTTAGAVEDPDCVEQAVANKAVNEGLKKLSGRLGGLGGALSGKGKLDENPCKTTGETAAAGTTPAAAPAPAATTGGLRLPNLKAGQARADGGRNCGALGAGCADGMNPLIACMNEKDGWLWKRLGDAVEAKRDASPGLSAQQRSEIDQDIAALRAAHAAGAPRVAVVDPARPDRYNTWLTPQEYSVAATQASQEINTHTQDCNAKHAKF